MKLFQNEGFKDFPVSPPVRGAWIETKRVSRFLEPFFASVPWVAPRAGGVD